MQRHEKRFGNNPRLGMVYKNLQKMDNQTKTDILERADWLLENLAEL
jgi:deoxyribodipyrimidine photolyase-like uncharacterized protein